MQRAVERVDGLPSGGDSAEPDEPDPRLLRRSGQRRLQVLLRIQILSSLARTQPQPRQAAPKKMRTQQITQLLRHYNI